MEVWSMKVWVHLLIIDTSEVMTYKILRKEHHGFCCSYNISRIF